jgi:hypothetical protein
MLNVIGLTDAVVNVGNQRVSHLPNTAIIYRGITPGVVGVMRIDRDTNHLNVTLLKLFQAVIEGNQLGGADKGKIERVEKEHRIFAGNALFQVEIGNNLAIAQYGISGKIGCLTAYKYAHVESP